MQRIIPQLALSKGPLLCRRWKSNANRLKVTTVIASKESSSSSSWWAPCVVGAAVAAAAITIPRHDNLQCDANSTFRLFVALDAKEEMEKVRLAQIIHDLHALAQENSEKRELRRHVTMVVMKGGDNNSKSPNRKPDIGDHISLDGVDLTKLSPKDATSLIEGIAHGSKLKIDSLQSLVVTATNLLKNEPNMVDIAKRKEPVSVVGDLHGSLGSLTHILQTIDVTKNIIVFDGDFVDRGDSSLEVLVTLLILKLAYPDRVYLIRGNHEDSMVASVYGFRDEIRHKYGSRGTRDVWDLMGNLFAALPLALRTATALIVHGGIPSPDFDLQQLQQLPTQARHKMTSVVNPQTPQEKFVAGIVWSDPTEENQHAAEQNPRGVGIIFGSQVARDFLKRHGLKYLVRGHQVVQSGIQDMNCGDGMSVFTVFSAAAYPAEEGTNKGALLHLYPDGSHGVESYSVGQTSASSDQLKKDATMQALTKVRSMIGCNRSKLEKAFAKVQTAGCVTVEQWVQVMGETIESAGMPWIALQPQLAPTSCFSGTIDVEAFLKSHSFKIHSSGMESTDAEILAENQEMLLTVFKFLDANGDGTLSPSEFRTGVKLLNKRLPAERQLKNPDDLFKSIDADGNGEISFEEFTNGFGMH